MHFNIDIWTTEINSINSLGFNLSTWNHDSLEHYLRSKYHYNLLNIVDCEEASDEDHIEIGYFDIENSYEWVCQGGDS